MHFNESCTENILVQDNRKWHLQLAMVLQWTENYNMHLRYFFSLLLFISKIHYQFCYLQVWIYNTAQ